MAITKYEQPENVVESVLAIRIEDISAILYTVQAQKGKQRSLWSSEEKSESGTNQAVLEITLKNGQILRHRGPVDQVRKRFDYVVNKLPSDTKEYLILNRNL